jgi:hypothetical protein
MSRRYFGGMISATTPTTTFRTATGVWRLTQEIQSQQAGNWPVTPLDPSFPYNSLLLSGSTPSTNTSPFNADASTNNSLITIVGDTKPNNVNPYTPGYYSNYLNGSSSYLSSTLSALGSGDFTIEYWIYPTADVNQYIFVLGTNWGDATGVQIINYSGQLSMTVGSASSTALLANPTINMWYHHAVVRSGSSVKFYVNGVASAVTLTTSTNLTATAFKLGYGTAGSWASFIGYISNLRIVIGTAVYTANFTPPTAPLTAISGTSLLTCQSNRFIDNSNNGFTLTATGSPTVNSKNSFATPTTYPLPTSYSGYFNNTCLSIPSGASASSFGASANFTIETWVMWPAAAGGNQTYIELVGVARLILGRTTTGFRLYNDGIVQDFTYTFSPGVWYHIAMVRVSGTNSVYINGVLANTPYANSTNWSFTTITIGRNSDSAEPMTGYVSNLRIVNGTAVYTGVFIPPTTPLTATQNPSTNIAPLAAPPTVDYLVVGGGGGGAGRVGGGGGAGGYLTGSASITAGTQYVITVGAAGTAGGNNGQGGNGGNTVVLGLTAYGGGGGNLESVAGSSGASGGGGGRPGAAAGGAAIYGLQGNAGGQAGPSTDRSGGGGGAGAPGATGNVSGTGGIGLQSSISGTALFYGGGGGGSGWNTPAGSGGAGGGGAGVSSPSGSAGTSGTINTGGGGGGGGYSGDGTMGGAGGSGIVILRYAATYPAATATTGSPTITVAGGYRVYTYTSSGSITLTFASTILLTCQSPTFIDNSTNNFTITAVGNTTPKTQNPFGTGVTNTAPSYLYGSTYFDGTGDYLSIPTNSGFDFQSSNFTAECWIYPIAFDAIDGAFMGVGQQSGSANWVIRGSADGSLNFGGWSSGTTAGISFSSAAGAITFNYWNHVAVTRSGSAWTIWANGVSVATTTNSTNLGNTGRPAYICYGFSTGAARYQNAYISNVRWVKGTAVYTTAFTPPTAPLTAIANTSLLTCQTNQPASNNVFLDNSTNAFAITRNGNTTQGTFSPFGANWSDYTAGVTSTTNKIDVSSGSAIGGTGVSYTIEGWYYFTAVSTGDNQNIFCTGNNIYPNRWIIDVYVTTTAVSLRLVTESNGILFNGSQVSMGLTTWVHLAAVNNNSANTFTFYINGTAAGSRAAVSLTSTSTYQLFCNSGSFSGTLPFYVSNYRIVNATAVYTSNFTPSTTPLTAISGTKLLLNSNRFIDSSGSGTTIIVNGTHSIQRFSPFSPVTQTPITYSGYFDGTGDYLTAPSSTAFAFGSGDFTIEAWIYPTLLSDHRTIFVTDGSNSSGIVLGFGAAGTPQIYYGASYYGTAGSIILNTWQHIAAVRRSGSLVIYVNGVGSTGQTLTSTNASTNPWIGGNPSAAASQLFYGYISNMRIVNGLAVYTGTFTPPTVPLQATQSAGTNIAAIGVQLDYLVVAGGGGGGGGNGGAGGGAGGLVYGTTSPASTTVIVITIGAGGTAGVNNGVSGGTGVSSVFGSITAAGGGGAGSGDNASNYIGIFGGSGGGGASTGGTAGAGGPAYPPGQGYAGGIGGTNASSWRSGGGGGGAGAVGNPVSGTNGGPGGVGLLYAITLPFAGIAGIATSTTLTVNTVTTGVIGVGTQVTGAGIPAGAYITALGTGAGATGTYIMSAAATATTAAVNITSTGVYYSGGGGGAALSGTAGTGGAGGGGAASTSGVATAGSANTGGGGGGSGQGAGTTGGAGGSGIVILRYPDSVTAATTTGSPTITVADGYRVYKFTASGSITIPQQVSLLTCQSPTFVDNSANAFAITVVGDTKPTQQNPFGFTNTYTSTYTPAVYGGSAYFDGTGDYLQLVESNSLNSTTFTVETWVYFNGFYSSGTGGDHVIDLGNGTYQNIILGTNGGGTASTNQARFLMRGDGNVSVFDLTGAVGGLVLNTWYHMVGVKSGANAALFVNGVRVASIGSLSNPTTTYTNLQIGKISSASGRYVNGYISNARLVNGSAVYDPTLTTLTIPTAPLTAISGTSLLLNMTSAGIYDSTSLTVLETVGDAKIIQTQTPYAGAYYSNYFNGTTDWITSASVTALGAGNWTIEFWINTSSTATQVVSDARSSSQGFYPAIAIDTSSKLYFYVNSATLLTTLTAITLNTWTHVALVKASTTTTFYINGVSSGTVIDTNTYLAGPITFGASGLTTDAHSAKYTGYISNYRMVVGTAVYTGTFTPPTTPLTATQNAGTNIAAITGTATSLLTCQSNKFVDNSNNAFALTPSGTPSVSITNPFLNRNGGNTMYFDGTGDSLSAPANAVFQFTGNYTIEFWIYFTSVAGTQDLVSNYVSNAAPDWTILISPSFQYYPSSGASYVNGPTPVANRWYHVAAVRSGTTCSMYIDGVSVGTPLTFSGTLGDATRPVYVGSRGGGSNYTFGYMSDVRITKGVARYTTTFTPPTAPFPTF